MKIAGHTNCFERPGTAGLQLCAIGVMLVLAAPLVLAAKPVCPGDHPSCDDDGGGGVFSRINITAGFVWDSNSSPRVLDPDSYDMEEASPWDGPYPQTVPPFTPPLLEHHPFGPGWDNWVENRLELLPRWCGLLNTFKPTGSGAYTCSYEDTKGGRISIDLEAAGMSWTDVTRGKKKDPGYCALLNDWGQIGLPEPPLLRFGTGGYWINFTEGCTSDFCPIEIGLRSFTGVTNDQGYIQLHPFYDLVDLDLVNSGGDPVTELEDVGPLTLWGIIDDPTVVNFAGLSETETNVFTLPQTLPVEQFRFEFHRTSGPSKPMASCLATGVQNIWLLTDPQ